MILPSLTLVWGLSLFAGKVLAGVHFDEGASWLTQCDVASGEAKQLLSPTALPQGLPADPRAQNIFLNPLLTHQVMEGFGAGLPQSSALVLHNLKQSNAELYAHTMTRLFASPAEGGAGMNMLRFPMGSCDFSMANTSYDEVDGDFSLSAFALDADTQRYVVEVLKDAKAINPDLHLIASPWSAPSWMKKLHTLLGISEANTLIDDDTVYNSYAQYFVKMIDAFSAQGLHIDFLTLQNEPLFGDNKEYPGMFLSAQQELRLAKILAPLIKGKRVKLLGYDHNWDHPEYAEELLKGKNSPFAGTAWHCYAGDGGEAQEIIHALFPDKEQHVTECTGSYPQGKCDISKGMTDFGFNHEWDMRNILLGATKHWASSGLKWILALDENCGPTLPLVSFQSGRPLVSIPSNAQSKDDIKFNQDFHTIAHMSQFIERGSYRIFSTGVGPSPDAVLSESFVNARTGILTTILMNLDHTNELSVKFVEGSNFLNDRVPPFSTKVYQWKIDL